RSVNRSSSAAWRSSNPSRPAARDSKSFSIKTSINSSLTSPPRSGGFPRRSSMATPPLKPPQDIEQLRKRHMALVQKKGSAEGALRSANEQLDNLRQQAREQFGTDDLEELKKRLES